jgi:arylsulfatase A
MNRRDFLLRAASAATMAVAGCATTPKSAASSPPNVIFILMDDMGWRDVGCTGSTVTPTPNIDRIAHEGIRFTQAYAACPVCSPTRISIQTGKYPARLRLTDWLKGTRSPVDSPVLTADYADQMELEELTIAEALKSAGYATGYIGKWHLGPEGFWPEQQGYDVNIGGTNAGGPRSYFWPRWKENVPVEGKVDGEYLTDRLSEEACSFIRSHKDGPFYLQLGHYAVHIPLMAKDDLTTSFAADFEGRPLRDREHMNAIYSAMIQSVDEGVGKILDTLRETGLDENTLVIFTSDNGGLSSNEAKNTPATSNWPLRKGKGHLYEGGLCVPLLMRWPARIDAGSACSQPICSIDYFSTICDVCGVNVASLPVVKPLDGVNFSSLLWNPTLPLAPRPLFWHYPHFANQGGRPGGVIREGDWKLIEYFDDGAIELYNLKYDNGETHNLARLEYGRAITMRDALHEWRRSVNANMPKPNPAWKPAPGTTQRPITEL